MVVHPALTVLVQTTQAQIESLKAEIGAMEANHKWQMEPRYERLKHLARELQELSK